LRVRVIGLSTSINGLRDLADQLAAWIGRQVQDAGLAGTVLGVSGGIDSALAAALCRQAVGDRAHGLILPCHSAPEDVADARTVADALGLRCQTIDIAPAYDSLAHALSGLAGAVDGLSEGTSRLASANLKPRLRMTTLYYYANLHGLMVVGTANRAETYVGYATKHGDAGVDLQPLAHLLKGEVRAMARVLGVPERIVSRTPSAGLWPGQTDEDEMGLTYDELDRYLVTGDAGPEAMRRIEQLHRASGHKRRMPASPPDHHQQHR